ncbi:Choline transporter-like protein 5, partial [Galemys pyrenaicus]
WVHGDPRRVAYPTDSKGHFCGQKGTPNENKTYLFYYNLFSCGSPSVMVNLQCPTTQICVSKCPEKFLTYLDMQFTYKKDKEYWTYYSQFCKSAVVQPAKRCFPDFSVTNGTLTVGNKTKFQDGNGKTRNAIELREAANHINKILDSRSIGMKVFEDYATTWYWILIGFAIAMFLSWMFVILLRYTAGFLFWIFVLGVIGVIGYGIWHCYQQYCKLQEKPNSHLTAYDIGLQIDLSMYFQLKQTWFAFMIALCILEVLVIIMLIFLRHRIRISIALLKEGSKAIGYIPTTLIYPFFTFIFLSICISYWAVIAVYPLVFNSTDIPRACPGAQCNFAFYGGSTLYHQYISTFQIFNLFVFLWLINFVVALGQCALAGAFATYYWTMKKPDDLPPCPLFTSFGRAIRYHTGSIAFGALILAIVQFFKCIIEYVDRHIKIANHNRFKYHLIGAQNNFARFLQCCLTCCFWCLDKAVKFLNRNAYVMIAIYGKNFCISARDAFNLLMRNILKVAVVDKLTDFVLLLGKILVAGCIGTLAFFLFTQRIPVIVEGPTTLNYYWVPLLTVILGSYLIAHGFFSVYAMCIETIFLCFCKFLVYNSEQEALEDVERNEGTTERPYYMSQTLLKILNDQNEVAKKP